MNAPKETRAKKAASAPKKAATAKAPTTKKAAPPKAAPKKAAMDSAAPKDEKVPLHKQPEFTMSRELLLATRTPHDDIIDEAGTRLDETETPGLFTAGELQSQNLPAILWELGACKEGAPVSVLVDALHVTVSDGPAARNFEGAVTVLRNGKPFVTVSAPSFHENEEAESNDQAPSTLVRRTIESHAEGATLRREAEYALFETTRFAIEDHPVPPPATMDVTGAKLAIVLLDPYESFF